MVVAPDNGMRRQGFAVAVALGSVLLTASGNGRVAPARVTPSVPPSSVPRPRSTPSRPSTVQIEMRNVRLHVADGVVLEVSRLRGEMVSRSNGPPVFDDGESYLLAVDDAAMTMDMASLNRLLNERVFASADAPVKQVTVRATPDGRLEQKGKLRKGIVLPFSMQAGVSPSPDGRLRLHLESMKVAGVPSRRLMQMFGVELQDLLKLERSRGIEVRDNDVTIDIGQVLPAPEIRGRLVAVEVESDRLVQRFARADGRRAASLTPPDRRARNYVYFSGGSIRFGKLTMTGADLQLIDADPRDAFDFFPARYKSQLVAGYSRNTPAGGLETYMPDFEDLRQPSRPDDRPPESPR